MNKTWFARGLVTLLVGAGAVVGGGSPAAAATTAYSASAGFAATQGANQWSYQKLAGATYSNFATYDSPNVRWSDGASTYPWVSGTAMHPENSYAAVRTWVAPGAGTVDITGGVAKGNALGDGVVASISRNGTILEKGTKFWAATLTTTATVSPTGVTGIAVAAGDAIHFVVDKNVDMGNDHTFWNPTVTFITPTGTGLAQPANSLSVTAYGAAPNDGVSDLPYFNLAIAAAITQGKTVYVPTGVFELNNVLTLNGVKLSGAGMAYTTLLSTDPSAGSIYIEGDNAGLSLLKHEYETVEARDGVPPKTSITVDNATNFTIDGVYALKATSGGILVLGSTTGQITNNRVEATNADGIHLTGHSSYITVSGNFIRGTGDDNIAVVSYRGDGAISHHNTIDSNDVGYNDARGIAVVGGEDVTITNNSISNSSAAGLYISVEVNYDTFDTNRVTLTGNTLDHCVVNTAIGHPSVLVFASQGSIDEITFTSNIIKNSLAGGLGAWGAGAIGDLYFNTNTLTNSAGAATNFAKGTIHLFGNTGF